MIKLAIGDHDTAYCCYTHTALVQDAPPVLIWIGLSKLREAFLYTDARKNSEWQRMTADRSLIIQVDIPFVSQRAADCVNWRFQMVRQHQPFCNVRGHIFSSRTPITCVETGVSYLNAADCARQLGIHPSTLSNHLNGNPSYKTIHGMTFVRGIN